MYLTLNELVEKIQNNIERLQDGRMELDEVEAHLDLVRELHERTIILKYKALEAKAVRKEEVIEAPITAPVELVQESAPEVVETPIEAEEEEEEEVQGFDLFGSMFAINETSQEEQVVEPVMDTPIVMEEIVEELPADELLVEPVIEAVIETPEVKEIAVEENVEEEGVEEVEAHAPVVETLTSNKHLAAFSQRLMEVNAEVSNQFGFSPLNTLIGSFGLNERLLYINELFGGSSEAFSEAVKDFDGLANLNQASQKVLAYADQNMWDVESSTVTEFMQKLCRRYA